ncbi:cyclin-dependent kinase inhibitor 3 family protein [Stenotrophomonas maltophilia]|uniref:cyclin-dependent kinase inhibitor 3 family protein n=1 Tax=Stenotrophomonas maltophilia TaxID=40324 RepID=UPI0011F0BA85|nr:cyclin-dependent kinase inhibitor 3 family protein [Stenotrophomonas maltophilia]MCF3476675.1 protein tyrosine phosphatase [Stenotrophomonas maltophilia]
MGRTSQSHPLVIATLPVGHNGGAVGVTFAPGKFQQNAMTGSWARDLDEDLAAIRNWGASHLITLLEPWEFEELRVQELPKRAAQHGLEWHSLPITDGDAPDARFLEPWARLGPTLCSLLLAGGRVVVHCKGGLGRAGTVASLLLLDTDTFGDAESVIEAVRASRPGAVETQIQEAFIDNWARRHS